MFSSVKLFGFQFRYDQISLMLLRTMYISLEISYCPLLEQENILVLWSVMKLLSEDLVYGNCTCHNYPTYSHINLSSLILKDVSFCHILIFILLSQKIVNTEILLFFFIFWEGRLSKPLSILWILSKYFKQHIQNNYANNMFGWTMLLIKLKNFVTF